MKMTGNTILITGGGSGIGRALAEYFQSNNNNVIIAGRNKAKLDDVVSHNPGMESIVLDITSVSSVESVSSALNEKYPALNVVIHNAGMMRPEIIGDGDFAVAEDTIATNLIGQIRFNSMLVPRLKQQEDATIMTVTSGLAFLPRADFPTYCASKAALHSYTESLRTQLADTSIQVIELVPPYVQTELQGPEQAVDPRAMPLSDFISEATTILATQPDVQEVCVERVQYQRTAAASGEYPERYTEFNARFAS
jgi:uncharacterized oxidoreductase